MRRRVFLFALLLLAFFLLARGRATAQAPGYVGSEKCAQCHGAKYESYQGTWHAKILRPARDDTVLGDFTSTDPDLTFSRADVGYVVGGQFSQRYLTRIDGELYVLPAQWNVTTGAWVAYHAEDWKGRPYVKYCAGCHTTGFEASTGKWVNDGVQCEACHGPGLEHVALAGDRARIVNPALLTFEQQTEICGQCHSRGHDPTGQYEFPIDYRPGGPLTLDEAFIRTSEAGAFWPDGSSRLHHQEYLDWGLSGHASGVACIFCHVSHSRGETLHQTRFVGNGRCVICHEEKKDLALHIPFHPLGEMVCTDCHMPTLGEAGTAEYNFDMHSHTFWPPNPVVTIQHGGQANMPNACNVCHTDQSAEWAAQAMGLQIGAVTPVPTTVFNAPPTTVPTATPFLGLSEKETGQQQRGSGGTLLLLAAGFGLLIAIVALILAIGRQRRQEGRKA